jgi:hypothetical protein
MVRQSVLPCVVALSVISAAAFSADPPLPLPHSGGPAEKIEHLIRAAEHLEAAGLAERAAELRELAKAERLQRDRRLLQEKLKELDSLQREIAELRRRTGEAEQVVIHTQVLEFHPQDLKAAGVELPLPKGKSVLGRDEARRLRSAVKSLRKQKLVKVLAEPDILSVLGRPATFLSGGEFPIPVPDGERKVHLQWRDYGVRMEAVATSQGDGRLKIELAPEISTRDFEHAVEIEGIRVPALTTRRLNLQVELKPGETAVVGDLISRQKIQQSGHQETNRETRLLVLITPEAAEDLHSP